MLLLRTILFYIGYWIVTITHATLSMGTVFFPISTRYAFITKLHTRMKFTSRNSYIIGPTDHGLTSNTTRFIYNVGGCSGFRRNHCSIFICGIHEICFTLEAVYVYDRFRQGATGFRLI